MNAVDTCWVSQKNKRRARAIEKSEMHAGRAGISSFEMACPLWRTDSD
jgi:arginine deiminase